jgi:hypothetical protein
MSTMPASGISPLAADATPSESGSTSLLRGLVDHWSKIAAIIAVVVSLANLAFNAAGNYAALENRQSVVETKLDIVSQQVNECRTDIKALLQRSVAK